MLKIIIIIAAILLFLVIVVPIAQSYFLYQKTLALEQKSSSFSRAFSDSDASGTRMRIVVLGDSTAVGTGSEDPNLTTAGRLGSLYPNAEIVNLAVNGLKIAGLNQILATVNPQQHFDLVLIQIGANDIVKMTSMKDIDTGVVQVLKTVRQFGGKVIILHSGNIGESGFFPWYVRWLLSRRSYEVRDIYEKEAPLYGVQYVDLIDSDANKTIESDPAKYYATDMFHLSGAGYGIWFDEISKKL